MNPNFRTWSNFWYFIGICGWSCAWPTVLFVWFASVYYRAYSNTSNFLPKTSPFHN